jgi:hypothetical protein
MSDPEFFKQDGEAIAAATAELENIDARLKERMAQWEDLESRSSL